MTHIKPRADLDDWNLYGDDEIEYESFGSADVDEDGEDTPTPRVYSLHSVSQAFADAVSKKPKSRSLKRPFKVGFYPRR